MYQIYYNNVTINNWSYIYECYRVVIFFDSHVYRLSAV